MNAIVFQLKRAHRSSVKAGRWLLQVVEDMTPARFDIMILIRNAGLKLNARTERKAKRRDTTLNFCFLEQRAIVQRLGLHKSTVSEALKRLKELGWITIERDYDDGRANLVVMTQLGLERLALACKILYRWDVVRRPTDHVVRQLDRRRRTRRSSRGSDACSGPARDRDCPTSCSNFSSDGSEPTAGAPLKTRFRTCA